MRCRKAIKTYSSGVRLKKMIHQEYHRHSADFYWWKWKENPSTSSSLIHVTWLVGIEVCVGEVDRNWGSSNRDLLAIKN